jgi:hypothetical protein
MLEEVEQAGAITIILVEMEELEEAERAELVPPPALLQEM